MLTATTRTLRLEITWDDLDSSRKFCPWTNPAAMALLRAAAEVSPPLAGMSIGFRPVAVTHKTVRVGSVEIPTPDQLVSFLNRWYAREDVRPLAVEIEIPPEPEPERKERGR